MIVLFMHFSTLLKMELAIFQSDAESIVLNLILTNWKMVSGN